MTVIEFIDSKISEHEKRRSELIPQYKTVVQEENKEKSSVQHLSDRLRLAKEKLAADKTELDRIVKQTVDQFEKLGVDPRRFNK